MPPLRALNAIRSTKFKDIAELRATSYGPVFTLADFKTGQCHLYDVKPRPNQSVPYRRLDEPFRSSLNEYGAASFCVVPQSDAVISINKSKVFFVPNDDGASPKCVVDHKELRFGDPHVTGNYLYMIADFSVGQGVIRYKLNELVAAADPSNVEPEVILKDKGFFYGGLASAPDGKHIAFNGWNSGMPFDTASVFIMTVDSNILKNVIGVNKGALLWPQFGTNDLVYYINDIDCSTTFERYSISEGEYAKVPAGKDPKDDVGDPYWIMGNQRFFLVTGDYLVYHIEGELVVYNLKTDEKRSIPMDTVDLLDVSPQKPNAIYFKSDGPVYKRVYAVDLQDTSLTPTVVYEIPYEDSTDFIMKPEPIVNQMIDGYLYQHSGRVLPTIIWLHGGPAMRVHNTIDLRKQAFVEAGYNLVDLVYTGSGGFGRYYRTSLYDNWGYKDVSDVLDAAKDLVDMEIAQRDAIYLVGSSAGAYLALASLAADEHNLIKAASVSASFTDARALLDDCPAFELAYTQQLLPSKRPARDIVTSLVEKKSNVAFFHGEFDPVVPSTDAKAVHEKLLEAGARTVFHQMAGEGHSFKKADNICFVVEETLRFFQQQ